MRKINGYPGQKNIPGLIQKIINQIPECSDFYELYAGSAAVSKEIAVGSMVPPNIFLNDIDPDVNTLLSIVQGASISNFDAITLLWSKAIEAAGTETFIFLDPPYMHGCRPNNTRLYKYEMDDVDHAALFLPVPYGTSLIRYRTYHF